MSLHPSTPPPMEHARHPSSTLWASPQFSDYFSDAGDSSTTPDSLRKPPADPVQSRIIARLEAIAKKVAGGAAEENDGSQTPHLLDFDKELSALEARLNAPDSQTREESGRLFVEDDEEEAKVLWEENEGLRREVREGRDVIARVTKLRESLQGHYDEMKNNFNLATHRLASADEEVASLRTSNSTLKSENAILRDHNARLHNDLQTAIPSISRLKAHLDNLASHTSSPDTDPQDLSDSIEHLQNEWADVDRDFEDLSRRYGSKRKNGTNVGVRTDSVIGSGGTPPNEEVRSVDGSGSGRESSPETLHRSRIIIKRGGVIRRIEAESSSSEEEEEAEQDGDEVLVEAPVAEDEEQEGGEVEEVEEEKSPLEQHGEVLQEEEVEGEGEKEADTTDNKKMQTPWEELWASIADFAGWQDPYEE